MASKITIKRSQTAAAPAGLSFGEMAFVQGSGLTANQLYVGISGGSPVWVGAQIPSQTTGTWTDTAAKTTLATQFAINDRISSLITSNTAGVASVNGLTGAVINVALTTNPLSQFAATTSSQLLGVISDETGTGSLVFATSPTLVTPALGTPSALVGTNITGTATSFTASNVTTNANLTGAITSVGNGTTLGSFNSAQLRVALTDETGTGVAVFGTTPTFTTSVVGSASMDVFNTTSTTVNGFGAATTMTLGATSGNAYVRNPILYLGNTTNTISTNSGTVNVLTLAPYGSLLLTAQSTSTLGGQFPSISIDNTDNAAGNVNINGGNLRLSTKTDSNPTTTAVNIVFEGATDNANDTTLTVTDPTANRTITLPDATGTVALTANKLSVFAATTSSELLGVISDETGTGSLVFATSPTLVTPALGTPSALVGTNITGTATAFTASNVTTNANLTGHITSTGNAAVLGSFTSAQLATALTDETGSGANVFATSPTLVTPTLGVAAATSINKVTITTPATGSTITVADGKTLTASNTLTFTGTDASSVAFGTGGTVVYTSGLGANVAAFLATPSSANLISAITDETGSGALVFANTPTLVTPNIGAATGTSLVLSGDLTVNGTTTTINSTTLTIDDINIELGSGVTYTNATANGGGITLKSYVDKTIIWDSTNSNWTSSEDWNLPTGKVFKINNASVLSANTLGSAIVTSSLTTVGTITSGTWSGSFGAVSGANLTNLTAGNLSGTIPSGVLANSTVYIGTTAVALNRTTASLALTGISIDGNAGTATTATTATNVVATEQTSGTIFLVGVAAASASTGLLVNATPATALTYDVTSGELSATLIDGGTF